MHFIFWTILRIVCPWHYLSNLTVFEIQVFEKRSIFWFVTIFTKTHRFRYMYFKYTGIKIENHFSTHGMRTRICKLQQLYLSHKNDYHKVSALFLIRNNFLIENVIQFLKHPKEDEKIIFTNKFSWLCISKLHISSARTLFIKTIFSNQNKSFSTLPFVLTP